MSAAAATVPARAPARPTKIHPALTMLRTIGRDIQHLVSKSVYDICRSNRPSAVPPPTIIPASKSRAAFRPRPCAIPQSSTAGGHKRHAAGGEGAVGRAERSDGDENVRQVSAYRHVGWCERL